MKYTHDLDWLCIRGIHNEVREHGPELYGPFREVLSCVPDAGILTNCSKA